MGCERGDNVDAVITDGVLTAGSWQEAFQTIDEAEAFIKGLEYFDPDDTTTEGPFEEVGVLGHHIEYVVNIRRFA
jgi:hypothetical protein